MRELLQSAVEAAKMGVTTALVVRDDDMQAECMDQLFALTEDDRNCERDDDLNIPSLWWGLSRRLYVITPAKLIRLRKHRPDVELVYAEHG